MCGGAGTTCQLLIRVSLLPLTGGFGGVHGSVGFELCFASVRARMNLLALFSAMAAGARAEVGI